MKIFFNYINQLFCFHKWKQISREPKLKTEKDAYCQYRIIYICEKCDKIDDTMSDVMIGFYVDDEKFMNDNNILLEKFK